MEKTEFKTIWEKTQMDLNRNFYFILKITLCLTLISTILSIFNFYDLKFIGFNIMYHDFWYVMLNSPKNSILFNVISYLFNFLIYLVQFIFLIYLFKAVTYKYLSFSQSFNMFLDKITPLFLMTIVYFTPIVMVFLVFYYFLIMNLFLYSIISLGLLLLVLFFSEYIIFYFYAILFRDKLFLDSYRYSYNLVKRNLWRTFLLPVYFIFKIFWTYFLLLVIFASFTFFRLESLYFFAKLIINFSIFWYIYLYMIFLTNYFLYLEKEKEINNELIYDLN